MATGRLACERVLPHLLLSGGVLAGRLMRRRRPGIGEGSRIIESCSILTTAANEVFRPVHELICTNAVKLDS